MVVVGSPYPCSQRPSPRQAAWSTTLAKPLPACPQTHCDARWFAFVDRNELTDVQRERLRPPLSPQTPLTGGPANDHRTVLDGIPLGPRTGCPWRALPAGFGSWKTVSSRFYRWTPAGAWDHLLAALQRRADPEHGSCPVAPVVLPVRRAGLVPVDHEASAAGRAEAQGHRLQRSPAGIQPSPTRRAAPNQRR